MLKPRSSFISLTRPTPGADPNADPQLIVPIRPSGQVKLRESDAVRYEL
jgi:hypothetical protein